MTLKSDLRVRKSERYSVVSELGHECKGLNMEGPRSSWILAFG